MERFLEETYGNKFYKKQKKILNVYPFKKIERKNKNVQYKKISFSTC